MNFRKTLFKSAVIFCGFYFALILLFSFQGARKAHAQYYSVVGSTILNILNPHIYTEFEDGAIENKNRWDFTFKIWDKRQYDSRIRVKSFRAKNPPKAIIYQNHYELFLLPSLFLISLFAASPIPIISRLIKSLSGLVIFYIFSSLYLSYRFELTLNRNELPYDSIWHFIIGLFGLGGNTDPIYVVCMLIWVVPMLTFFKKYLINYF